MGRRGSDLRGRLQTVAVVVVVLLTAACGARLNNEERAAGVGALTAGGGESGSEFTDTFGGEEFSTDGSTGPTGQGGTTGRTSARTGGRTGGGTTGQTGGGGGGGPQQRGALKATDTGVTPEKIVVANIADVSGVQPGLFKAVQDAAKAATAYINSQGGINGRQIDLRPLDSKTDSGANRAATLEACQKAFAIVGSMSALDDGGAKAGEECGIPDMTAITTNEPRYRANNVYPAFPNGGDLIAIGNALHIKNTYPDVIKSGGMLWLNQAVTKNNAALRMEAWQSIGFEFPYQQEVQVVEADYSRFVIDMRNRGIQYVSMVANYQNLVRLQQSMRQQSYFPKVRDWDSVAYDPGYIEQGGDSVEGSFVFLNTHIFEEKGSVPEMQLYEQWLRRAVPGAKVTYFGLYSWSAFRLFQKLATEVGPDLTRKKMLEKMRSVPTWDGNGLHAPHKYGAKEPAPCYLYVKVENAAFTRMHPGSGLACEGGHYRFK